MASSRSENVGGIIQSILYLSIFALYVIGMFHSCTKHSESDFQAALWIPPWAVYRGAEKFWHKDHSEKEWDAILKDDAKTIFVFLNSDPTDAGNAYSTKSEIKKFASHISTYPPDKIEYLKTAARQYIDFSLSVLNDVAQISNDFHEKSIIGDNTKAIADSISILYEYSDVKQLIHTVDSEAVASVASGRYSDTLFMNDLHKKEVVYYDKSKNTFEDLYKQIFSESADLKK